MVNGADAFFTLQARDLLKAAHTQLDESAYLFMQLGFYVGFASYMAGLKEEGFDICLPEILPREKRLMEVCDARNSLLASGNGEEVKVVSNGISHNADSNMFLITGPNNGRKTTYVKTTGLLQLLGQNGLPIPSSSARMSVVDGIHTHFVAPDDITEEEGRYRNELRRMRTILEGATPYSLVILDEPCGGTSYEEGIEQSRVLLRAFHRLGVPTYFTTHMHPLTQDIESGRLPAARNLHVGCTANNGTIEYTFKIERGSSGKSYGAEVARDVGLEKRKIGRMISERADSEGFRALLRK